LYFARSQKDGVVMSTLMHFIERPEPNPNIPELRPGDTVRVHNRIVEGNRERIQVFQGVVMRLRKGGVNASFTVRRIASHGVGVERTFFFQSPRVKKVEVLRHGKVRRARLYFLRERQGKKARLREVRRVTSEESEE
jgi:large subunit ribosomal protein L19